MKGNAIYFAFASLLAITGALADKTVSFVGFCILILFLCFYKKWNLKWVALLIASSTILFYRGEWAVSMQVTNLLPEQKEFSITFLDSIKVDGDLLSAQVEDQSGEKLMLRYEISSEQEKYSLSQTLHPGLVCSIQGQLEQPSRAVNPNGFDYQLYLQRNSIYWILEPQRVSLTDCSSSKTSSPAIFFQNLRYSGITYINTYFPEQTAGLAAALIFGDRKGIDFEIVTAYQRLGIVHLLAISGLHVGLLAGLLFYIGLRMGFTRERMITVLLLILPFYALLTGAAPSVIRAVCMLMVALTAKRFEFQIPTSDIISFVFSLYLFISPYTIFHIGFQLSFLITFALLLSAPVLTKKISNPFYLSLQTSFVCLLASLPIMFYYFYEVSVLSLIANIIYIPLFSWLLLPILFFLFFLHLLIGNMITFLLTMLEVLIVFVNKSSEWVSEFPFAVLRLGIPSSTILLFYAAGIILFFVLWEKRTGYKAFMGNLFIPTAVILLHYAVNTFSLYGEVTMLDVGQGDSIFIKLPFAQGNYLIDTGGILQFEEEPWQVREKPFEVGRDTIVPFLKSKGVRKIDKLIITHGDVDHIGGSEAVLNAMNVKQLLLAAEDEPSQAEQELITKAEKKGVNIQKVHEGTGWKSGESSFRILMPTETSSSDSENDGSIVMYGEIGGLRWLFTGDVEESSEKKLIERYGSLNADVLKVGHHGSKTSTSIELLHTVQPRYALISAGRNNLYGHPHIEVIEKLKEEKIVILRTDLHGGITYKFKGGQGTFFTVLP
ncbi:DNA internalization-related competence protein ComEC/Rec2 [Cytobacillus gottheilii]|uniref:DNA internalization-related competence protein ComEC/Rec2 n=1 Tax=Cytobacillus gottheilii TaxID=859144 RepID=UPI0009BA5F76|nr:DNA internalization-related competence protein ComEC/Rec2 [Cytobacillus gottheilii]